MGIFNQLKNWVGRARTGLLFASLVLGLMGTGPSVVRGQSTDTQPPFVSSTSPAASATGVSVAVTIKATFNEPVQAGSISMELRDSSDAIVAGIGNYDETTRTVSFDPTATLGGAGTYRATILGAVDTAGNGMLAPFEWTFTTATPGFQESTIFSGLVEPTVMQFSSDGRVFVGEKSGLIKVFDDLTDTTPTVFADLRTNVHNFWDRGLLGLALHPNFPATPYVYVLYTYDAPIGGVAPTFGSVGGTSDPCPTPDPGCIVSSRLSRLTASGNTMTGTEEILVSDWVQQSPSHSTGALAFGSDGALYATGGDGANFGFADYGQIGNPAGDPPSPAGTSLTLPTAEGGSFRSQDLVTPADPVGLDGTVIRVDPDTGAALSDNPLFSNSDANARRIVAHGLRNPFRIAIRPGTREIWVGDVGWTTAEEINRIVDPLDPFVENFGWPCYEATTPLDAFGGSNLCQQLYATPTSVTEPYYSYSPPGGKSITGLAFYEGTKFPETYNGALFWADYTLSSISVMFADNDGLPDPATAVSFVVNAASPVDLKIHDGDLYYVDFGGTIRRVRYFSGNQPPQAVLQATTLAGPAPLFVSFDASSSTDPDNDVLSFSWDLNGDGIFGDSTSPQPTITFTESGVHRVSLKVTDSGLSDIASVTVLTDDTYPVPTINTPLTSLTWRVGDSIAFDGSATDAEDGPLPTSSLNWSLILHHCPSTCHVHPVQSFPGLGSGFFIAPDHVYPSHLELRLTAVDSSGLVNSTSVLLYPATAQLSFESVPPGVPLTVGSVSSNTPFTQTVIQGSTISISAPQTRLVGGDTYDFKQWSDGGAATHNVVVGTVGATYVASYERPLDITLQGTPIALITAPAGIGNPNLEVIRDGVMPPVGSSDPSQHYDTYTGDTARTFDWIGYEFATSKTFAGLTFQQGTQYSPAGGWFTDLQVQVRSGGVWNDVADLVSTPAYAGANGMSYEQFALRFTPIVGDAVRIAGPPGGVDRFISVGELRVLAVTPATGFLDLGSPNGGETLVAGTSHPIIWTAAGFSSVDLEYRTSSAGEWLPIATGVAAFNGSYAWTVPATFTSQARVRVTKTGNPSLSDLSDADFTITSGHVTDPTDVTAQGTPTALITMPQGIGNHDLEVIRDGVFPPIDSSDPAQQYDTYTGDMARSFDWIGYQFAAPKTFTGLTFQEGPQFGDAGGWFTALRVQVRTGGVWTDVAGLVSTPEYAGANGINYEQFVLQFTPITGDAIRIAGQPGGLWRFISVGELRAMAGTLTLGSLTLSSPNGGETLVVGTSHAITWTSNGIAAVDLAYRTSSAGAWLPIATAVTASGGSYSWTVPATVTTEARVQITETGNPILSDLSNADFAITTGKGEMTTPAPGSTLTASAVTFEWTAGNGVSQFWLYVGTSVGGSNLFTQDRGTNLTATVPNLPTDGSTVYVRLFSRINGTWLFNDYTYTAATATTAKAEMTTPAPGSTLSASTVAFQWTAGNGVSQYWLYVGTSVGASNLYTQDRGTSVTATVPNLPTNGSIVHVRLFSRINGSWLFNDYTYTATTAAGGTQMTTPAPGSTLTASTVTFQWTAGSGVSQYWLYVGTSVGASNLFTQDRGTSLTATVPNLPTDGSTVYVRLFSRVNGSWLFNDYTYTATTASGATQMTTPAPGSTLTASTVTFQWTGGSGVSQYWLYVGTSVGGSNLFTQDRGTSLTATVPNLPTDGSTVYVRLFSRVNGSWLFNDYTYTAATATTAQAVMTTPAPGSTLSASTVMFQWTAGNGVSQYWLYVGTSVGASNLYTADRGTSLTATVPNLPTNGSTVHVRLFSRINGTWLFNDYTYTAAP